MKVRRLSCLFKKIKKERNRKQTFFDQLYHFSTLVNRLENISVVLGSWTPEGSGASVQTDGVLCIHRSRACVAAPPAFCVAAVPVETTPLWPASSTPASCCWGWRWPASCWCPAWRDSWRRWAESSLHTHTQLSLTLTNTQTRTFRAGEQHAVLRGMGVQFLDCGNITPTCPVMDLIRSLQS